MDSILLAFVWFIAATALGLHFFNVSFSEILLGSQHIHMEKVAHNCAFSGNNTSQLEQHESKAKFFLVLAVVMLASSPLCINYKMWWLPAPIAFLSIVYALSSVAELLNDNEHGKDSGLRHVCSYTSSNVQASQLHYENGWNYKKGLYSLCTANIFLYTLLFMAIRLGFI